ncbi:ATP-binding protein [Treponema zioleckii]|uniref:ATP-binding protein n=1 Tax=Treponema zioleckii TaxID=331680 RepID=UPI001F5B8179|nr:ATP-binding protein [Treponema zioleckii]
MSVFAFFGPSGTGKSFRAKLIAQKQGIKVIIDDGLLIQDDQILAGRSAKLENSYMGAVRVALFDDKAHRDDVAKAILRHRIKKILILGTSEKMVNKIALRLQLPLPEKYIRIEDVATPEQMEEARRSRQIEGKHVIPVRAYEMKDKNYSKIFVNTIRVALARRKWFSKFFNKNNKNDSPAAPTANSKLFEKSVVRPAFAIPARKNISHAILANLSVTYMAEFNKEIRIKKLSIKTGNAGYSFTMTIDLPFGSNLAEITQKIKDYEIKMVEKESGILIEDIFIVIDKILPPSPTNSPSSKPA